MMSATDFTATPARSDETLLTNVRVEPPKSSRWLLWVIVALFSLPFLLVLPMAVLKPESLQDEPATFPAFAFVAVMAVVAARRLLRPIVLHFDEFRDIARFELPRLMWSSRIVERPLHSLQRLETEQSGSVRQVAYGYSYPMWSLYAYFADGSELKLRSDIVAPEAPWLNACAAVNAWCEQRDARTTS